MEMKKICIIHLNQIGDLVFSLPLLKAIRDNYPGARIHSVIKPYLKGLLKDSDYVDEIFTRDEGISAKFQLLRTLRENSYDLLISLARSQEALLLTALSRAKTKAGFVNFPWDFSLDVKETVAGHNCWINNARLLGKLGVNVVKNDYVGLLKVKDGAVPHNMPEKYVVISAGASPRRLVKAWDEEKFAEVIISLYREYGLTPVLVGAGDTVECNALIRKYVSERTHPETIDVIDLTGGMGLRELYTLLSKADLFVGIDSGVMHLASSAGIPVVALFGPTDPDYVGPLNSRSFVVREKMKCVPCYLNRSCKDIDCMRNLGVEAVLDACVRLMDRSEP
jgi:heptosyltransferase-2